MHEGNYYKLDRVQHPHQHLFTKLCEYEYDRDKEKSKQFYTLAISNETISDNELNELFAQYSGKSIDINKALILSLIEDKPDKETIDILFKHTYLDGIPELIISAVPKPKKIDFVGFALAGMRAEKVERNPYPYHQTNTPICSGSWALHEATVIPHTTFDIADKTMFGEYKAIINKLGTAIDNACKVLVNLHSSLPNFCHKNDRVKVLLKNGKTTHGKVISCKGEYADVVVNGKTVLINSKGEVT